MMIRTALAILLAAGVAPAADLYRSSLAAYGIAGAADVASSYGQREGNPLVITGSRGQFDGSSLALKAGIMGGIFAIEHIAMRKYPRARRVFTVVNFGLAGQTGFVAARNVGRRR